MTANLNLEAVVVTYNSAQHIRPCITSLLENGAQIIVVDNGSSDETLKVIAVDFPEVRVIAAGENLGYGKALNRGIANTVSPFILAANADTVFPHGSLRVLAEYLKNNSRVGILGAQEVYPDGSWQRSYADMPSLSEGVKTLLGVTSVKHVIHRLSWRYRPARSSKKVGYVDGAILMIRRKAFDEIRGFDEKFHFYCEEADLCLRLRQAGWDVVSLRNVKLIHVRGGSSTKSEGYSDKFLFAQANTKCQLLEKHKPRWHADLYRRIAMLHAKKMHLVYRALQAVGPASSRQHASTMARTFEREARIWAGLKSQTGCS